ncbi:MAG: tetratricopeptide repeat protein [Treponema sp.]|jgi:tetratricopeptide (TPR) repeat protein|nr:tetratricopeptide repeat protein [Treponema sp.]
MKKRTISGALRAALWCAVMAAAASGCANSPAPASNPIPANNPVPADGLSLDEGIARIAHDHEAGLPENTRIAVVNFESPSAFFSDYVLEELQAVLVNNKRLVVTERANLELLRNELDFQMSGEVSDESAIPIGRRLGAQVIVTGGLTDLGGSYRCRFNAIDIEKAVRQVSPGVTIRNDRTVAYMLPKETPAALPATIPAKPDPALAVLYFNVGFAHYEAKRYAEAVADFTRALEIKADDEGSLRYRAYAYNGLQDYDKAIGDASRLIGMQPDNAEHYFIRGNASYYKGEYDHAIVDYNEALRLNPNSVETYNNRGNAYADKGEYDRAIGDYNQALRLNPNFAEAYNNRGTAYWGKGEHDRAIGDYNQALRLNPNYAKAYNNRGYAYSMKKDYARARADWEKALQLNPSNAYARECLEWLRGIGH